MTNPVPLVADSLLQSSADIVTGLVMMFFAWLGSRCGLYISTVWGLQALASVVAAFGLCDWVDSWLVWAGMTNEFGEIWRQTIAFVGTLLVVAVGISMAIGASIEDGATNYPPLVDLAGGAVVGAVTGMIVAGILQVVLAMAPLPERFAFDSTKTGLDLGAGIIELVGRCAVGMQPEDREILMDGEPGFKPDKVDPTPPAPAAPVDASSPPVEKIELPQWSEVFADTNWNQMFDKGEKYLDADGDGAFTWVMRSNDRNTSKTRDIGLRERYKLGPWVTVRTLDKQLVQRLQRAGKLGQIQGIPWPPPGGFNPGVTAGTAAAAANGTATATAPGVGTPTPVAPGTSPPGPVPAVDMPGDVPQTIPPGPAPVVPPQAPGSLPGTPKRPRQPSAVTQPRAVPPKNAQEPAAPPPAETPKEPANAEEPAGSSPEAPSDDTPPKPPPGPKNPFKPKKS